MLPNDISVKFKTTKVNPLPKPSAIRYCVPFVVVQKETPHDRSICIRTGNGAAIFFDADGSCSWLGGKDGDNWLDANYEVVDDSAELTIKIG